MKILTSLELFTVVRELQGLAGTKVSKIYQPKSHTLLINFFKTGGTKYNLKIESGVGMYVTSYETQNPLTPSTFCLFLRKHLNNATLVHIKQNDLERIVEFHFDTKDGLKILICELFSKGNFVLCDSTYKILNSASIQKWKDRTVKPGEIYKYPPPSFNLLSLNKQLMRQYLSKYPQYEIVRLVATLGLGGTYAEEVCIVAKLDKNTIAQTLNEKELETLYVAISKVIDNFKSKIKPQVIYEGDKPTDATPFPLSFYSDKERKDVDSFNQAIDLLYTTELVTRDRSQALAKYEDEKRRLENIYETQKRSLEAYEQEYNQNQKLAENIYNNYQTISTIFSKIKAAVDAGHDWYEVYQVLQREKEAGIYEANQVKEIKAETRQIIIDVGEDLALDLTKSLEENASDLYDKAKRARAKYEGAQQILEKSKQELDKLEISKETAQQDIEVHAPKPIQKTHQEWYEKFHWFKTSSGLLAIGGRDATSNEIIVKKYMEINDMVFHTEIAGSPFFILKNARDKATEQDLKEVAQATAAYSAAWKLGAAAVDVYQIKPEQVRKDIGLPKGSFMIHGKRNYFRNTALGIAVGATDDGKVMGGPREAIRTHTKNYVILKQGSLKKSDIAKQISIKLSIPDIDAVMRALPTGEMQITT